MITALDGLAAGETAVLATVIDIRGSGYRLPGARMLILHDGGTFGTVSGGCLEADIIERSRRVHESGQSEVFTYDTTDNEDSVFSMNMGCRGVVRVLLERVDRSSPIIAALRMAIEKRLRMAIATLIDGGADGEIGGRAFFASEHEFTVDRLVWPDAETLGLRAACVEFAGSDKQHAVASFTTAAGKAEFSFERIEPPVRAVIFGAGADAIPLAAIASELGWEVEIYDHRPAFLRPERFPASAHLHAIDTEKRHVEPSADERTAIVVMTHNYARDRVYLPAAFTSKAFYIGMLGPRRRTDQLLDELRSDGLSFGDEDLARLYAPIGLDIGAAAPETIAVAIVAEIQSALAHREGGYLRDRTAPIYDRK